VAGNHWNPLPCTAETALQPPLAAVLVENVVTLGLTGSVKAGNALVEPAERRDGDRRQRSHDRGVGLMSRLGGPLPRLLALWLFWRRVE